MCVFLQIDALLLDIVFLLALPAEPARKLDATLPALLPSLKEKLALPQHTLVTTAPESVKKPEGEWSRIKKQTKKNLVFSCSNVLFFFLPAPRTVGLDKLKSRILALSQGSPVAEEKAEPVKKEEGITLKALRGHVRSTFLDNPSGAEFLLSLWCVAICSV